VHQWRRACAKNRMTQMSCAFALPFPVLALVLGKEKEGATMAPDPHKGMESVGGNRRDTDIDDDDDDLEMDLESHGDTPIRRACGIAAAMAVFLGPASAALLVFVGLRYGLATSAAETVFLTCVTYVMALAGSMAAVGAYLC